MDEDDCQKCWAQLPGLGEDLVSVITFPMLNSKEHKRMVDFYRIKVPTFWRTRNATRNITTGVEVSLENMMDQL